MAEGSNSQHTEEEEVATDAADRKLSTARSSHASSRPMLTDAANTNHPQPLHKTNQGPREKIDTSQAPRSTPACGKMVGAMSSAIRVPPAELKGYRFRCVICNEALRNQKAVFTHFVPCVRRNGNPGGARWHDHASIDDAKIPNSLRRPA